MNLIKSRKTSGKMARVLKEKGYYNDKINEIHKRMVLKE